MMKIICKKLNCPSIIYNYFGNTSIIHITLMFENFYFNIVRVIIIHAGSLSFLIVDKNGFSCKLTFTFYKWHPKCLKHFNINLGVKKYFLNYNIAYLTTAVVQVIQECGKNYMFSRIQFTTKLELKNNIVQNNIERFLICIFSNITLRVKIEM